jgi:pyridoxamine 5'-phosphate oxidase
MSLNVNFTQFALMNLSEIRKNYILHQLNEEETGSNPVEFFQKWLTQAIVSEVHEPTAMVLSTISADNKPRSRVVLLKGLQDDSFIFYTNYESAKGKEIKNNPAGALLFFWKELERQVRIEGHIEKVSSEESDRYFNSRPLESRIGAIISPQSMVVENRAYLESLFISQSERILSEEDIKRPQHWGGYSLKPELIEFWQGRASRLHDRIRFRLVNGQWEKERLAP